MKHELAVGKWKEHGEKLVELPHLHKRVRTAYIAIDALNNRGIRRHVVLSGGRPTTVMDGDRRREAREAITAAIGALEEHASTGGMSRHRWCGDLGSRRHGQTLGLGWEQPGALLRLGIVVARLAELITDS